MNAVDSYRSGIKALNRNMRLFFLIVFSTSLALCVNEILYNLYLQNLGFDNAQIASIGSMHFWAAFSGIACGMLSDRLGRKRSMYFACIMYATGFFMRIYLTTMPMLMLATFSVGVAASLFNVSMNPFIAEQVEEQHRTHIFSLLSAFNMGAGIFGFSFGGILPDLLTARGIDLVVSQRIALSMSGLLYLLVLIPIAMMREQRSVATKADTELPRRTDMLQLIRNLPREDLKIVVAFIVPRFMYGIGAGMVIPLLSVYLRTQYQVNSTTIGLIQSAGQFTIVIATVLGPMLSRRFGLVGAATQMWLLSVPFLLLMGNSPWLSLAVIGYLARGALANAFMPLLNTFLMNNVSEANRGFATSCVDMADSLGRAAFMSAGGAISQSYGFPFLYNICSIFFVGSGLLFFILNRKKDRSVGASL